MPHSLRSGAPFSPTSRLALRASRPFAVALGLPFSLRARIRFGRRLWLRLAVALAIGGRSAGYLVQAIVLLDSQLSAWFVLSAAVPPRAFCVKRSGASASSFSFPLLPSAAAASFYSLAAGVPRASFVKRGGLSAAMLFLFHASSAAATALLFLVAFSLHSRYILVAFVQAWLL